MHPLCPLNIESLEWFGLALVTKKALHRLHRKPYGIGAVWIQTTLDLYDG